ncbi:MAG: hypothetical protein JST68_06815 [Bacteroidetes bacterium]|nr:hypothetical protein [Bacteroidota bacterium]
MKRSLNSIKKIALAAALIVTVGVTSSFANDRNDVIKASFQKDFQKAELIEMKSSQSYTQLTFKMNDMVMFAFYNDNGELLAVTRNIKSNQLPIQLLLDLKRDYKNYWITDLFEFNGDGTNSYYVTVENADGTVTLRADNSTSWQLFSKKNK